MVKCSYCDSEIKKGTGKMFIRDNGQVLNFCKSKCEKNMMKLGRDARKFKWTAFFEKGEAPVAKAKTAKKAAPKKAAVKTATKKTTKKE